MSDSSLCRLTVETKLGSHSAVRVAILTRNLSSCVMRSYAQNVISVGLQGNRAPSLRNGGSWKAGAEVKGAGSCPSCPPPSPPSVFAHALTPVTRENYTTRITAVETDFDKLYLKTHVSATVT